MSLNTIPDAVFLQEYICATIDGEFPETSFFNMFQDDAVDEVFKTGAETLVVEFRRAVYVQTGKALGEIFAESEDYYIFCTEKSRKKSRSPQADLQGERRSQDRMFASQGRRDLQRDLLPVAAVNVDPAGAVAEP